MHAIEPRSGTVELDELCTPPPSNIKKTVSASVNILPPALKQRNSSAKKRLNKAISFAVEDDGDILQNDAIEDSY